MLNPLLTSSLQAGLHLPPEESLAHQPAVRLQPEEADTLLRRLVQERWPRLSSEYHDPLGMLFSNRAKQWTTGWDTQGQALLLLVWETHSWQEKPVWSLYRNGTLIFQEEDGCSPQRGKHLHQLLESDQLPFIEHHAFLEPLTNYRFTELERRQATQALMHTILARPEFFEHAKEFLFQALEADLGNPDWPLLDVLKIHRLAHKNPLVDLFRQFVQTGLIRTTKDSIRLNHALVQLQKDFTQQGLTISPLLQPLYTQAYNYFRQIITHGSWRIKLQMSIPAY